MLWERGRSLQQPDAVSVCVFAGRSTAEWRAGPHAMESGHNRRLRAVFDLLVQRLRAHLLVLSLPPLAGSVPSRPGDGGRPAASIADGVFGPTNYFRTKSRPRGPMLCEFQSHP